MKAKPPSAPASLTNTVPTRTDASDGSGPRTSPAAPGCDAFRPRLRRKRLKAEQPYHVFGYTVVPAIYNNSQATATAHPLNERQF